ncbi:MAG: vWA domain-containing protein [Candidatus Kapaibacteriota bacterium]
MHFLNPFYLLGLVLAAIPIVIHLLILRKNKIVDFSSLRFLKELQKTQIKKIKIKQWLLLVLRTLIIVFLSLSFARPVVRSNFPLLRNYSNVSAVIIMDNSISMDISDENGNRYRQAKRIISNLLDNFTDGDEVALILTTGNTKIPMLTKDYEELKQEISRTNISTSISSFENSLRIAQKILDNSKNFSREVFIVSDFQKSSLLPAKDSMKLFDNRTAVNLIHVGAKSSISINNISIDSIAPITKIFELGKNADFEVYLSNSSNLPVDILVLTLFINGERTAQRLFNISAKGKQKVVIGGTVKSSGIARCLFEIESDAFEYDNKRWSSFIVPNVFKIGLVEENDNGYIHSFFKNFEGEKFSLQSLKPSQVATSNLKDLSTIVLEDLPSDDESLLNLKEFTSFGKGILIFPPSNGGTDVLNKAFQLLGVSQSFEFKSFPLDNSPTFTFIDKNHPLFAGVFVPGSESIDLIPDPPKLKNLISTNAGVSIIQTNAGQFLTEFNIGGSKILFCGVAPNLQWGNFPLSSIFPVILYRSVLYLSGTSENNYNLVCGEPLNIVLPKMFSSNVYRIEDPLSNVNSLQAIQLPSGNLLEVSNLYILGTYVLKDGNDKPIGSISVNIDSRESMLDLADAKVIEEYFKSLLHKSVKIHYVDETKNVKLSEFRDFAGTELWKLFLILAIIIALIEMYVAKNIKVNASIS